LKPFRFLSASAGTDFRSAHDLIATRHPRAPEDPAIFPGTGEPESDLADADEDEEGTADDRGSVDTTNNDVDEDKEDEENDSEGEGEGESCAAAMSSAAPSRGAPASLAAVANASTQPYAPAPFRPPCLYPYLPVVPTFPRPRGLPGAPHSLPRRRRGFNSRGPESAGHLLGHRGA